MSNGSVKKPLAALSPFTMARDRLTMLGIAATCAGIFIAASGVLIAVMRVLGVRNVEPRTKRLR